MCNYNTSNRLARFRVAKQSHAGSKWSSAIAAFTSIALLITIAVAHARGTAKDEQHALTPVSATFTALNISSGTAKTLLQVDKQSVSTTTLAGDSAYIATSNKKVLSLDSRTGRVKWEYNANKPIFSLLVTANELYVGAGASLIALDPANGTLRWTFDGDMALLDPVLVDGLIVFNTIDGPIALDPATGKDKWRLNIQWGYFVFSPLSDKRLCVWKPDEIFIIDTDTGKTLWQTTADNSVSAPGALPSPAVACNDVICQLRGSRKDPRDWSLFALDAATGNVRWKTNLGDFHGAAARTLIAGKMAYCVLDETVFAVDLTTGKKKWEAAAKPLDTAAGAMSANATTLFLSQFGGSLLALDAKTGERKWLNESTLPSRKNTMRIAAAVVSGDSIYVSRNEFTDQE